MQKLKLLGRLPAAFLATATGRLRSGPSRPGWSFGFEVVARALRQTALAIGELPPLEQRRAWQGLAPPNPLRRQVEVRRVDAGGVPCRWIIPVGVGDLSPVLVYLHGGAYRYGSFESHGELASRIARAAGARVLFVDYRLCPEHRFPAAVEDAVAAVRWVLRRVPAAQVVVGGDSAGGALTLAALVTLRDAGATLPAGGLCICPWVDPTARGGSLVENAQWDWAAPAHFAQWVQTYVDEGQARDPRVSPTYADLRGLPPLLVQVGSAEMLRDQVVAFARKAEDAGVEVQLSVAQDMIHDWHTLAGMFPEAARAIDACGAFVRERTGTPRRSPPQVSPGA